MNFLQKLKPAQYQYIIKEGYTLDKVYLLGLCIEGKDTTSLPNYCLYLLGKLQAAGLVDENNYATIEGRRLFEQLLKPVKGKKTDKKDIPHYEDFIKWWSAFPSTDNIVIDGKVLFNGCRALKTQKDNCAQKFAKIIDEGIYETGDLIRALKYEINQKIQKSKEMGLNKLSYMQNTMTYLNNRTFENFIEISRVSEPIINEPSKANMLV